MNLYIRRSIPVVVIVLLMAVILRLMVPEATEHQSGLAKRVPPTIEVVPIHAVTQSILIESHGTVEPDVAMLLSSQVAGKIIEITEFFEPGRLVKQGTLLARIDSLDHRIKLQEAESELLQAEAALIEEQAEHEIAASNWKDVQIKPSRLALREPQMKKALAKLKLAQAKLEKARLNMTRLEIRAPFDGLIEKRNIKLGQHVAATDEIGSVLGTEYARIRLPIRPQDLPLLAAERSQVSLQNATGQAWQATVSYVEKLMDKSTRMYYLIAKIKDPYQLNSSTKASLKLPFSTLVDALIVGKKWPNLVKMPMTSLYKDQVLTIDEANRLHQQPVTILYRDQQAVYFQFPGHEHEQLVYTPLELPEVGQVYAIQPRVLPETANPKSLSTL